MSADEIQLSARGKALYAWLDLTVILLLLYAVSFILTALAELPANPLAGLFDSDALGAFSAHTLTLLLGSGMLSAMTMMAGAAMNASAISRLRRIWIGCVGITVAASPFVASAWLASATALALLPALAWTARGRQAALDLRVWQLGALLLVIALPAAQLANGALAEALRVLQFHAAFALCGLSALFWLMTRYSTVPADWARDGLRIVAVCVLLGGGLISLGPLSLPLLVGLSAAPLILISYCILASHSHRGLRNRNANASLAPHWIALATLLWLVGAGVFGAISVQPTVAAAMRGTHLAAAQTWLAAWTILAITLAFINEAALSLRGDNRRVTGYAPLWLIAFGVVLASVAQLCRGVVQVYLREVAGLGNPEAAELLLPLTVIWLVCLLSVAAGIAAYALGYWLRHPKIRVMVS